jgi:hypothetical protein
LKGFVSQLDLLESSISAAVVFALHTVREEQNRAEMELPIVRPPQVGGYLRAKPSPTAASSPGLGQSSAGSSPGTGQSSRAQRRKFKQPICWKYTEKGQCHYSCKKRHISKEALAVINCPHFEQKGSCRFHETTGTCWYGHGVSVEASPPVNLVVGLPYPPLPGSALPADVGVPPPLSSAIGADFGSKTEPGYLLILALKRSPQKPLMQRFKLLLLHPWSIV